jgi:hypothetical protein
LGKKPLPADELQSVIEMPLVIELNVADLLVVVVSLGTTAAVGIVAWLAKGYLRRIERSLASIASHTTKLAVIETKLAAIETRLGRAEGDLGEVKDGVCQLRRDHGAPASRS